MSPNLKWKFDKNRVGEPEGPQHPGMTNFAGDRATAIIREAIQNSLDAKDPGKEGPVVVSFQRRMLNKSLLAADSLRQRLQYAVKSDDNADEYRSTFEQAIALVGGGGSEIVSLCIADSNTTGASDIKQNGKPSYWKTLTKGEGLTNKPEKDSAGSFGIGKFASFLASPLRTVLYTTAFVDNGNLQHRFMGKTILVSHKDQKGKYYRRTGYLGKEFCPLKDDDVPGSVKLSESGTAIYIPGYSFTGGRKEWEKRSTAIVLENYFHAIIQGGLEVQIRDRKINKKTHSRYLKEIPRDKSIHNFALLSLADPVDNCHIPDIGDISIRIKIDTEDRRREIALVRDAGMLITTDRKKMLPKLGLIPKHWWGFTVIIECKSQGHALLKQAESPRHDKISIDFISNEELRKTAKNLFDKIGKWCYEIIQEFAEPDAGADSENVSELAEFLPLEGDDPNDTGEEETGSQGNPIVTKPIQTHRAPRRPKKPRKKKPDEPSVVDLPDDNGNVSPYVPEDEKGKRKKKRGVRVSPKPQSFTGVRFRKGSHDTHSVIVSFDQPEGTPSRIEVHSIGEDGTSYPMNIREAFAKGDKLRVENYNLFSLPQSEPGDRHEIEIFTNNPVIDKALSIRFFEEEETEEDVSDEV